jgi:hypothetical protein
MIKMAWHFLVSMVRHWWAKKRGYAIFTPAAAQAYRDQQCAGCSRNEEGQCLECKCLVLSKTMMALEECPIGKWHRVWIRRKM